MNRLHKFDVLILFLSICSIILLILESFVITNSEISQVFFYFDTTLCIFFFVDFLINLKNAPNKLQYMKWGWIDLLSSIPNVEFLRIARVIRIIKIVRIIKSAKIIYKSFILNSSSVFLVSILLAFLSILIASALILQFETLPESNIKTAEDAIWWAYTTITTVGYGDKFPITTAGRLVATILMTIGVGLFGTVTASFASILTEHKS